MRITVGVEGGPEDEMTARMLRRLDLRATEMDMVHAVSPVTWWAGDVAVSAELAQETLDAQREAGEDALDAARVRFEGIADSVRGVLEYGSPADRLLRHAKDHPGDLVAVGGHPRRAFAALLAGSVGRGLVVSAPGSLLVVKGGVRRNGPLHVVLATDHSEYAEKCVDVLRELGPRGIGALTILTALPEDERPDSAVDRDDAAAAVAERLRRRGERIKAELAPLGIPTIDVRVAYGTPEEVIPATMAETGAELLIVGARGHGWFDRLSLGSVSYRQVVTELYPVLVLRTPQPVEDIRSVETVEATFA